MKSTRHLVGLHAGALAAVMAMGAFAGSPGADYRNTYEPPEPEPEPAPQPKAAPPPEPSAAADLARIASAQRRQAAKVERQAKGFVQHSEKEPTP